MNANDLKNSSETDWERVDQMTDEEVDTSDIPALNDAFFANAQLRLPKGKVPVVMSVDADVFQWFKSQGAEYQNLINTALRIYAEQHKS
jgi:uncharacterized protein (DUF4415 family)